MSCFGSSDDDVLEANGVCPDCGEETHDGESIWNSCSYSPVICQTCKDQPCDESC